MATSKGGKVYVLIHNCKVLGAWSNLKILCEEMTERAEGFPSYHTLVRLDKTNGELSLTARDGKDYQIKIELVK